MNKQVDVFCICPQTHKRIAIECVVSTAAFEPSQAVKDAEFTDYVLVLALTRSDLLKLKREFENQLPYLDERITLIRPCDLKDCQLHELATFPGLVFDRKQLKTTKRR